MKKLFTIFFIVFIAVLCSFSIRNEPFARQYISTYSLKLKGFNSQQLSLLSAIQQADLNSGVDREKVRDQIAAARIEL
jgi:Gpi18-like mannosyltransferase